MPGVYPLPVNTATDPATGTRTLNPEPINFNADWRVTDDKPGEVTLSNINAPLGQPETLRIASAEIADIYKNSPIDLPEPGMGAGASKKGQSILVQLNTVSTSSTTGYAAPLSIHMVIKLPLDGQPSGDDVQNLVERLIGSLYDTGTTSLTSRVAAVLRGAVTPVDL